MQQYGRRDVPPTSPNHDPVSYVVTGQTRSFGLDANSRPVPGFEVQFKTASGLPGAVFIPDGQYTLTNVQAAIVQQAQHIEAVAKLTS